MPRSANITTSTEEVHEDAEHEELALLDPIFDDCVAPADGDLENLVGPDGAEIVEGPVAKPEADAEALAYPDTPPRPRWGDLSTLQRVVALRLIYGRGPRQAWR